MCGMRSTLQRAVAVYRSLHSANDGGGESGVVHGGYARNGGATG